MGLATTVQRKATPSGNSITSFGENFLTYVDQQRTSNPQMKSKNWGDPRMYLILAEYLDNSFFQQM